MKQNLVNFLNKELPIDVSSLLEKPKHESHGDVSLPCFLVAKELKKNPVQTAKELEASLGKKLPSFISKVQAVGPFLNFYLNAEQEAEEIFKTFNDGSALEYRAEKSERIIVEYPSPNTNKALHVGHSRNMLLGNGLCGIFKKVGHKVIRTNMNNDRGIAVCKAMLSYKLFGENKTPEDMNLLGDEFVSHWYVLFGEKAKEDETLEDQAQEMLVKWEEEDKEVRALWKKLLDWVFEGYKTTFENYHVGEFDQEYFESDIYTKGRAIILKALEKKVEGFDKEEDGAVFIDLEEKGWGKKYLLRGDGTSMYITFDMYLAELKEKEFSPDRSVFVVAEDQQYHFNVLFEILRRLGFGGNEKNYHFSYGYVYDKNGKKFSSRKGNTIDANWLVTEMVAQAKKNLLQKELTKDLEEKELARRAEVIGYGALAFTFLRANPVSAIHFDMDKALSFEGETGPYVQYTYARIQSIFRKTSYKRDEKIDHSLFGESEMSLIKVLKEYPLVLKDAAEKYKLSAIAHYVVKVAQHFNEFYQNTSIMRSEENKKKALLLLADNTARVLEDGLKVLGIDVLEEM